MMDELPKKIQKMDESASEEKLECLLLSLFESKPNLSNAIRGDIRQNPTDVLSQLMWHGIKKNDTELIRRLLKSKPRLDNYVGHMMLRASIKNPQFASMLVLAGAKVELSLWYIMAEEPSPQMEQLALLVIQHGANVKIANAKGDTAMFWAIENNLLALVRHLFRRGASIDKRCALAVDDYSEFIQVFIDGTSDDKENRNLCAGVLLPILAEADCMEEFELLLKLDLPLTSTMETLNLTIEWQSVKIMKILLQYSPQIIDRVKNDVSLLFKASSHKKSLISRIFIEYDADINGRYDGHLGDYPLHTACRKGSLENVQLLIHLGADVNVVNVLGMTPLSTVKTVLGHFLAYIQNRLYKTPNDQVIDVFVKHFAVMTFKGIPVSERNLESVVQSGFKQKYCNCLSELEKMKQTHVYNSIPLSCLFDENDTKLLALARNDDFLASFRLKIERHTFPNYYTQMIHSLLLARKKNDAIASREQALQQLFNEILSVQLPFIVIEKIVGYSYRDELKKVERTYYLNFHDDIGIYI